VSTPLRIVPISAVEVENTVLECVGGPAIVLDLNQRKSCVKPLNDAMTVHDESISEENRAGLGHPFKSAEKKLKDLVLHYHLAHWHPVTTAPCNQCLEIRVVDNNKVTALPFPTK
jgi:hypothetical protein